MSDKQDGELRKELRTITGIQNNAFLDKIVILIRSKERAAQHLHKFDDDTYKCVYCGLTNRELGDNTAELQGDRND